MDIIYGIILFPLFVVVALVLYERVLKLKHSRALEYQKRETLRVIDNYSKWLEPSFPMVGRTLQNLRAQLNGEGLNSGTPGINDNCTIGGLRSQLSQLAWDGSGTYQEGCPCQKCSEKATVHAADDLALLQRAHHALNHTLCYLEEGDPATTGNYGDACVVLAELQERLR